MKARFLKAGPNTIEVADADTEAWLAKKAYGTFIEVDAKEPRNGAHHRLFWALVKKVFENQEVWPTQDLLVAALKIGAGCSTTIHVKLPDESMAATFLPKSISFGKMDQGQFDRFYDRVCDVVIRDFWPSMRKDTLKAEVAEMVGIGAYHEDALSERR